jgi:hypothetical protein
MNDEEKYIVSRLVLIKEYEKHISECDYPEDVEALIAEYRETFKPELLDEIEYSFPIKTIKEVTGIVALFEDGLLSPVTKLKLWLAALGRRTMVIAAVIAIFLFQVFFRYQYKVVASGIATVKIDRLTGKTELVRNYAKK